MPIMGRSYSNEQAARIIASEGIGYGVQCYASGNQMQDPETARLWEEARKALDELEAHLEPWQIEM